MKSDKNDYVCPYNTNDFGIITSPGKFEGEMYYVPYYWDMILNGFQNGDYWVNDRAFSYFNLTLQDCKIFPELCDCTILTLWEDDQGFLFSVYYKENDHMPKELKEDLSYL